MAWFTQLLIGLALSIISYLIAPKPKAPQPPETRDMDDPVAQAGMPIPVVFGSVTVKGLNILWWGEKQTVRRELKKKSGKK